MFKKPEPTSLETEIERVLDDMITHAPDSKEYKDILETYERLCELRPKKDKLVSGDAVLGAVVNLLGIGAVLGHERLNVITTKAFSWIKPRNIL